MDVEAGASAGAGRAVRPAPDWHRNVRPRAGEVADQRLQRLAQLAEALRQIARQRAAGIVNRSHHAAAPEQRPLGRIVHDHVGDQTGEIDVVGADRQQDQIERAVGLAALRSGEGFAQFGELGVDGAASSGRRISTAGNRARVASRTARRRWWRRCRPAADRSPRCADIARQAPARCGSGSCTASGGRPNWTTARSGAARPAECQALRRRVRLYSRRGSAGNIANSPSPR